MNLPKNEEEAKEYACNYTCRMKTKEEIEELIRQSEEALKGNLQKDLADYNTKQLKELKRLLSSKDFINGDYHQGIDNILFELIEWRAMFYAFQNVDVKNQPFGTHVFFEQWKVGGAYAMYCSLAKLVSNDKSLRHLWLVVEIFIKDIKNKEEIEHISKLLAKDSKRFSSSVSKSIYFRNKVIAHNEKSIDADLESLDKDISFLVRVWSIVTMWSAFPMESPFRTSESAFSGLELFYSSEELNQLKTKRQEYLEKIKRDCRINLVTLQDENRSPFRTQPVSVSFRKPS